MPPKHRPICTVSSTVLNILNKSKENEEIFQGTIEAGWCKAWMRVDLPIPGSILLVVKKELGEGVQIKGSPGSAGLNAMSSVLSNRQWKEEMLLWRRKNCWSTEVGVAGKTKNG